MKPVVAIVGRPNVGKSTLANKLSGQRLSIIEDTPGVTRDRIYSEAEWNCYAFTLIDTGGIEPRPDDEIFRHMRVQTEIAIETADVILFVLNLHDGVTADDREIALMLKKSGRHIIPCVNKVDNTGATPTGFYEFYELGFAHDPMPVSSLNGNGTGDLLDVVTSCFPNHEELDMGDDDSIKVAVIGKPNAGKSSLVNYILGEERMIVSPIAGTTRDAIDAKVENKHGEFTFIDTAGIRRQSKIADKIEKYSVLRAKMAVERADVCLIMIDAGQGVTEQDERIAGLAHEAGKAAIFVVNKWDTITKDNDTVKDFTDDVYKAFAYMTYAPLVFVSAKTGQRVDKIFEHIKYVHEQASLRISTGKLNEILADAVMRHQPPSDRGKPLKLYYMTQTGVCPPTFVIFCNRADLFHFSYQRFIENHIRRVFGFSGTPIRIIVKPRGGE
ncbi:MAG: ribosome biogenesis GTPase Der [Oscillospiraceae bacterium]|nr:ribosome biogenesis GTPase Der [Oscillospiraceae bacterium]